MAIGGSLLFTRGVLMLRYPDVLQELARHEPLGTKLGLQIETSFGAIGLLVIGAGWCAAGIAIGLGI